MTTALHFDAASHRYSIDGRELISVTQVLTEAGFIEPRWYTEDAALRGTYVHAAVQLFHEDALAADSLDASLQPYFNAYQAFLRDSGFVVEASEERVCDEVRGYAGTLDLRGHFPRPSLRQPGLDVIDIKTGSVPSWVGYQTAAYARTLPRELGAVRWRWALNLRHDGTYRVVPLEGRSDEQVFLAALTVAQAKRGWLS